MTCARFGLFVMEIYRFASVFKVIGKILGEPVQNFVDC
jgi:hypothetical protein